MPTLVCFGDSITAKEKEMDGKLRLTSRIRERMSDWTVINAGVAKATSRDGLARFQEDVLHHNPDLVTILFGRNDAYDFQHVALKEYKRNLTYMIQKMTPQKTILISPLPMNGVSDEQIKRYADETKAIASETGCRFINLWAIGQRKPLLEKDGVTMNETGYQLLAEIIIDQMKQLDMKKATSS